MAAKRRMRLRESPCGTSVRARAGLRRSTDGSSSPIRIGGPQFARWQEEYETKILPAIVLFGVALSGCLPMFKCPLPDAEGTEELVKPFLGEWMPIEILRKRFDVHPASVSVEFDTERGVVSVKLIDGEKTLSIPCTLHTLGSRLLLCRNAQALPESRVRYEIYELIKVESDPEVLQLHSLNSGLIERAIQENRLMGSVKGEGFWKVTEIEEASNSLPGFFAAHPDIFEASPAVVLRKVADAK